MNDLPAGYVNLGSAAIHVTKLREYTTDVRRFLQCFPICERLQAHPPGSEEWREVVRGLTEDERKGVAVTLDESGRLFHALASGLKVGTHE